MKVLSANQIRAWDAYTIAHEPIASIDLMERASSKVAAWLTTRFERPVPFYVFCGRGNNGGDGLAVSRMLHQAGYPVEVMVLGGENASPDFLTNLGRLQQYSLKPLVLQCEEDIPLIPENACLVDALFGTGISRALDGLAAAVVEVINNLPNPVVSIDMPSGLPADEPAHGQHIVRATYTLSFQCPKLAFFMPESERFVGEWEVLDIGLHPTFPEHEELAFEWLLPSSGWLQPRTVSRFAHKGYRGHVLLGAGSPEMMGAAIMSAQAALRSGAGLVTCAVHPSGWPILQQAAPEAMCVDEEHLLDNAFHERRRISAIAIGPGWPVHHEQLLHLSRLLGQTALPVVVDASALFLLATEPSLLLHRPQGSITILTPHVGEFDRMFGHCPNDFERLRLAIAKAVEFRVIIVLKGAYTRVITPGGLVYFNSTGNPGMAKGGSGDVLTGLLAGLLAQRYPDVLAALMAVYLHGSAGDIAAAKYTQQGMTAMDIARSLPAAWKTIGA